MSKCPSFLRRQEPRIAVSEVPAFAGTTGFLTLGNPLNSELLLDGGYQKTLKLPQVNSVLTLHPANPPQIKIYVPAQSHVTI